MSDAEQEEASARRRDLGPHRERRDALTDRRHRWNDVRRVAGPLFAAALCLCLAAPAAAQMATGTYVGDGVDGRAITGLGFRPDVVLVKANDTKPAVILTSTMGGVGKELAWNRPAATTFFSSLDDDGFTVRNSDRTNKAGKRYDWVAFQADAGRLEVGQYVGYVFSNRLIPLEFRPSYVIVIPQGAYQSLQRSEAMPYDVSLPFDNEGALNDRIQNFTDQGFVIGSSSDVNGWLETYHYVAWRAEPYRTMAGSYLGDGQPLREVRDAGWRPSWVLTKSVDPEEGVHLGSALAGSGTSQHFDDKANESNDILDLLSDGFSVGSDKDANQAGRTFYWSAFGNLCDPAIMVSADRDTVREGETFQLTYTLSNEGPDPVEHLVASLTLPAGLVRVASVVEPGAAFDPDAGTWTLERLGAGAMVQESLTVRVASGAAGQLLQVEALLEDFAGNDPDLTDNVDAALITVPYVADLAAGVSASVPQPDPGSQFDLTFTLDNAGPHAATEVLGQVSLPAGLAYVSHTQTAGSYDPLAAAWTLGTLGAGAGAVLTVTVAVGADQAGRDLSTSIAASSAVLDPDPTDDSAAVTVTGNATDLRVIKSVDNDVPLPGDEVVFLIAVANDGPADAVDVRLLDLLPAGLAYVASSVSQGNYASGNGQWRVGDLAVGEAALLQITAEVVAGAVGTIVNTATVDRVTPPDANAANDTASASVTIHGVDLAAGAAVNVPAPDPGDVVEFTFEYTNQGTRDATGMVAAVVLPTGLTYAGHIAEQGAFDPGSGAWNVGALAASAMARLRVTAAVDAGTAGQVLGADLGVTALDQSDINPANDAASASVAVRAVNLSLSKSVDDPTPSQGSQVIFSLLLANAGPDTATGVAVADTLPAGLQYVSDGASQGSYDPVTGLWDVGELAPAATAQLDLTALVNLDVSGGDTAVNHGWIVAADQGDPDPADDHDTASLSLASADLHLTAAVDEPAPVAGDPVRFTLTLRNDGPSVATGVAVRDTLVAGLTYQAHAPATPSYDPTTGLWDVGDLAAGAEITLTLDAMVDADRSGQVLTTRPRVVATDLADPDDADNEAQVPLTVQAADLDLTWASLPDPTEGDTLVARLTLHDGGPDPLQNADVQVTLPAGLTLLDAAASQGGYAAGLWSVAGLAAGADAVLDLTLRVDGGTATSDLVLAARVVAARPGDPAPGTDPAELSLHVRGADLVVEKAVNVAEARPGETVIYTLTVRNDGPDDAGGVVLGDALPAGLAYAAHIPGTESYDPATGAWQVGDLAAGATATLFLQAVVGEALPGASVVNTAALLDADLTDLDAGNDAAAAAFTVPAADVGLSWHASAPAAVVGDTLDLTLAAANDGPAAASGLVVDVLLPAGLELAAYGAGYDPVLGRWVVGSVAAGASADMTLTVRVGAAAAGAIATVAAAVAQLDQGDPDPADDTASLALPVAEDADLALALSADQIRPDVGDTLTWTLTLTNRGPDAAAGVAVVDTLPAGLAVEAWTAGQGVYDPTTHLWNVGDLPADAAVSLDLATIVPAGLGGSDLTAVAVVAAADVHDRDPANDRAELTLGVSQADLALESWADVAAAGEGDDVLLTLAVHNLGPDAATGVAVVDTLPAGLSYVGHTPPDETFTQQAPGVWRWDVGAVPTGAPRVLFLRARVDAGITGAVLRHAAAVTASVQEDPEPDNDGAANLISVVGADLVLTATLDPTAAEGDTVRARLVLTNQGPLDAAGLAVDVARHAKLLHVAATPASAFEAATGRWTPGALAAGAAATLDLDLRVDELSGGLDLNVDAAVVQSDHVDPTPADAAAGAVVAVQVPGSGRILLTPLPTADAVARPLGEPAELLRLQAVNWSVRTDTLTSLALTDAAVLEGAPAGEGVWGDVELWRENDGNWQPVQTLNDPFGEAETALAGLGLIFAPGDTVRLSLRGAASALAPDGTRLGVALNGPGALGFGSPVDVEADWPLVTASAVVVDGFVAAQAAVHDVAGGVVAPGEIRRPVLDVTLPADGGRPATLRELQFVNLGTAQPVVDVARLEVWADDGDGGFAGTDALLGEAVWTGDRWRLSGLDRTIPPGGRRVFVTVDAAAAADGQRSLRLAVPVDGVTVDGGNDGPVDASLANPYTQVVGGTDRLYMAAVGRPWRVVQPDGSEQLLLHLTATNTYDVPRTVSSLRLTGNVRSPWTEDQDVLDAVVAQLVLRADADDDGALSDDDPVLGAVSLVDGAAVFGGLDWRVPPSTTGHLFVSARLAPDLAADGDDVSVNVASAVDVQLAGGGEVAGAWPLDGGGGLRVDGLLARRLTVRHGGTVLAPPGAVDRLVLDLHVPGNGHAADVLQALTVENRGTATALDVARLRLWRDGGDDAFDAGAEGGDDEPLADLAAQYGVWSASGLDLPVAAAGARLYVAAELAVAARDSAVVDLAVPLGGLAYASDDDGPLDAAVPGGHVLIVGDGALLAGVDLAPRDVVVGQDATLTLTVRNQGLAPLTGVAPAPPQIAGDGVAEVVAGPVPAQADLAPGAEAAFSWTVRGLAAGQAVLTVAAAGQDPEGAPVASLPLAAPALQVVQSAPEISLAAVSQLPFAVNGGQNDVSVLTLTLHHPGDQNASAVRLDTLAVRLADGAGAPLDAAAVVDRILLRSDGAPLLAYTPAPGAGDVLHLVPATPSLLAPGGTGVLTLALDVAAADPGTDFRFLLDADGLVLRDAVAGTRVEAALGAGEFPVASEVARVVAGARPLSLALAADASREVSRGQTAVDLGTLLLANPGDADLDAAIQVGAVRLALADAEGTPLAAPGASLAALELCRDGVLLARRTLAPADTMLSLALDTPLDVDPGADLDLTVLADLRGEAPATTLRLALTDAAGWDARDANSGAPVPVLPAAQPLLGPVVTVVDPAALAHLGGRAVGAVALTAGAAGQALLELDLRHPGSAGTAPVALDSLVLTCRDARGEPLNPASVLTGLSLKAGGVLLGAAAAPDAADGRVRLGLAGAVCAPGETLALDLSADLRSAASTDTFAVTVALADVRVTDAHLGSPVPLTPDAGAVLPLASGPRVIRVAADEMVVAARDVMPAVIAAMGAETPVLELDLTNPAPYSAGDLVLNALTVGFAAGGDKAVAAVGGLVAEVVVRWGHRIWARSGPLAPGADTVELRGDAPLAVAAGESPTLVVGVLLADGLREGSLTASLDLDGLDVSQPEGELVDVRVLPAPGQSFPLVTLAGTVSPASLAESYSNFPNPFAAGREATTFVFGLDAPARVALRVYTPRGELVRTLLAEEDRAAGLHQDVVWDGRNGKGDPVRNGVYVAEIVVREAGGGTETLRRNVAVVR